MSIELDTCDEKPIVFCQQNADPKMQVTWRQKGTQTCPFYRHKGKATTKKKKKMPKVHTQRKIQNKVPNKQTLKDTVDNESSNMDLNEQDANVSSNTVEHAFDSWTVKKLKDFVGQCGIPTSYKKSELIQLAEAAEVTNLPVDPDFANDSLKACLEECLTLPAGKQIPDPFKMTHLSRHVLSATIWPSRHT